jgi:integrase/recombinase XerD
MGELNSARSAQQIFINPRIKACISRRVSFHSAAQFCDPPSGKGVDIKYIKEIPGHFDIQTTEVYLHVSKKDLVNICSPLDDLMENEFYNPVIGATPTYIKRIRELVRINVLKYLD